MIIIAKFPTTEYINFGLTPICEYIYNTDMNKLSAITDGLKNGQLIESSNWAI